MMGSDSSIKTETGRSWSNGFTEVLYLAGSFSGDPGLSVAEKDLTSIGTVQTTFTTTDSGDEMVAIVATFKLEAAGGGNNTPAVAAAIADTTVAQDNPAIDNYRDLKAVFADVEEGSALTYSILSNTNSGLVTPTIVPADSTLDLSFTASTTGSATITIRATDSGGLFVDDVFIVTVTVVPAVAVTPDTTAAGRLPSNGTNYTVDFNVVNTGSGTDDYDLLTTKSPGTAITVVSITGTGVTQDADPDSARVSSVAAADTAIVTVTYSVADVAAGTADTLFFTARSVASPATTDDGRLELTVVRPNLTTGKAVSPTGTQLPGTELTYTVTITNDGSQDAAGVVVLDSLAVELDFKVGSVVNNLPSGVTATVEYSNDTGSTWTYTPVSAGCSAPVTFDSCVTHIRWTLQNDLSYVGPDNTGNVQFVTRIQ